MKEEGSFRTHAAAVRERLRAAGAEGLARAGPGSITWRVNRERIVVAGWARAILLQLAHPLVAAGVAEHSTFGAHAFAPVQRLRSTIGAMLALTFGDEEEMVAAAAGINVIHDRVFGRLATRVGPYADGTPYSAHQADLLAWVHATLLDSIPLTYERLVGRLSREERDRYCREAALMEPLLDIPPGTLPRDAASLARYMRAMIDGGRIAVGPEARSLGRAVLAPPGSLPAWPALRPIRLLAVGTLPAPVRNAYGFPWTARDARALARWTRVLRTANRVAPGFVRYWPASARQP